MGQGSLCSFPEPNGAIAGGACFCPLRLVNRGHSTQKPKYFPDLIFPSFVVSRCSLAVNGLVFCGNKHYLRLEALEIQGHSS